MRRDGLVNAFPTTAANNDTISCDLEPWLDVSGVRFQPGDFQRVAVNLIHSHMLCRNIWNCIDGGGGGRGILFAERKRLQKANKLGLRGLRSSNVLTN